MTQTITPDAICAHVGCYNISAWLGDLAAWLQVAREQLMPAPPQREHQFADAARGLYLTLRHPHAGHAAVGDPARWILTQARFVATPTPSGAGGNLPFGLSAASETPATAQQKLGKHETTPLSARDIGGGDLRQSYFLADGRVLEITWKRGLTGIDAIVIVRLGREVDIDDLV